MNKIYTFLSFLLLIGWVCLSPLYAHALSFEEGNKKFQFKYSDEKDILGRPIWYQFDPNYTGKIIDERNKHYATLGPNGTPTKFYLMNYVNENKANIGKTDSIGNKRDITPYFMFYFPIPLTTDLSMQDLSVYDIGKLWENNQKVVKGDGLGVVGYQGNLKNQAVDPWGAARWGTGTGFQQLLAGPYKGNYYEWRYVGYAQEGMAVPNPYFLPDYETGSLVGKYDPYVRDKWFFLREHLVEFRGSTFAHQLWGNMEFSETQMKSWIPKYFFRDHPAVKERSLNIDFWYKYLGVANDPSLYSGVWYLHRIETDGREYYSAFMTSATMGPNMRVVSYEVYDKKTDKLVAKVTRSETEHEKYTAETKYETKYFQAGATYKIKVRVKNMVEATYKEQPAYSTLINGKETTLQELVQYDDKINLFHKYSEMARNQTALAPHQTAIKPQEIATFEYEYTVPEEKGPKSKLKLSAQIPTFYHTYGKNFATADDDAFIILEAQPENLRIHFDGYYDGSKNLAEGVVPGETIWVKYLVEKTIKGKPVTPADLIIEINDGGYSKVAGTYLFEGAYDKKGNPLPKGELVNEGDYAEVWASFVSNTNTVCTIGEIPSHWYQKGLNHDLTDDRVKPPCLTTPRNIVVQNVNATPDTVYLYNNEWSRYIPYSLIWEVAYYSTDLKTNVTFPVVSTGIGQRKLENVTLRPNQTITMSTNFAGNVSQGAYRFTVEANPAPRIVKESSSKGDPYVDNVGWDTVNVLRNPDSLNYICPTGVIRVNEWTEKLSFSEYFMEKEWYNIYDKDGNVIGQSYRCPIIDSNYWTETYSFYERFEIARIMFKSKYTEDKKQGSGGWIDIKNGGTGIVKAGSGFNFYIEVEYQTNRASLHPPDIYRNCSYSLTINPKPIPSDSEHSIEVIMPIKDDRGRTVYLYPSYQARGGWDNRTYRYDIGNKETANESEQKYYVHINADNTGAVPGRVTTTPIPGSPNKPYVRYLCDIQTFNIEVRGSYLDDLKTHITQ